VLASRAPPLPILSITCAATVADAMKTDQAGQVAFETMCKDLGQIQDEQNTGNASGSAAAVRNANAVVRVAQIGAKRSKNIAQGGSACTVKDFMKHLQNKFPGPADGDDDTPCLDWQKNAKVMFALAPALRRHQTGDARFLKRIVAAPVRDANSERDRNSTFSLHQRLAYV